MNAIGLIKKLKMAPRRILDDIFNKESEILAIGRILSETISAKTNYKSISDFEFKIFSQFGDDGIIQWLIHNMQIEEENFVEFGVQDYKESNTRFLLMNNNWSGMVIDGSAKNIKKIINSSYYWRHALQAEHAFVNRDNINNLLLTSGFGKNIGLLHIDIDGMDYWVWEKISAITPSILILEYNSLFGCERAITVPYDAEFIRSRYHYSNLYFGASLVALCDLSNKKGYAFIGCNSAGNNAYFVKRNLLCGIIQELSPEEGYIASKFRECRDKHGLLNFIDRSEMIKQITGMPVYNTRTMKIEPF
jgi:hypothetical protein